jgi:hypothetical protein
LKKKYQFLERLLELSYMHLRTSPNKGKVEDLRVECSFFLTSVLSDFEARYKEGCDFFEYNELLQQSSTDEFLKQFQRLQQDWNDLQAKNQQLELKLLNIFIRSYPVTIF